MYDRSFDLFDELLKGWGSARQFGHLSDLDRGLICTYACKYGHLGLHGTGIQRYRVLGRQTYIDTDAHTQRDRQTDI